MRRCDCHPTRATWGARCGKSAWRVLRGGTSTSDIVARPVPTHHNADDILLGFQHRVEADRFLELFRERLGKFGLELHPDKTRRIEFGRYAERDREQRGEGKPETFDFLGFTHISGKNRNGTFTVRRMTIRKRTRAKQLRKRMHDPVAQTGAWLKSVVQGYFNYYAVPGNTEF